MAATLTLWMQVSLDGYAAGPDDAFDWPVVGPELHRYFVDELAPADAFVYGRRVFEWMAAFWPGAAEDAHAGELHREYGRIWVPMPKLVLSSSLATADWNATVVADVDDLAARKAGASGSWVCFGGPSTAGALVAAGLVDEFRLFVHPVLVGGGVPLFPSPAGRRAVELVQARTFDDAVVHLHYRAR